jgi:acetyltransferase-like isoleucine patch superfamily enzyme
MMIRNIFNRFLHKIAYVAPGGKSFRPWLHRMRGVQVGRKVWISQFVYIDEIHPEGVSIGDNTTIGLRTSIFSHFYWGGREENNHGHVLIEKDVFVGPHCVILPNVRIGEGAVIKAGTVVTRDVPPHTFWGIPHAEALGTVTVPLTPDYSYEEFIKGLKPIRRKRKNGILD